MAKQCFDSIVKFLTDAVVEQIGLVSAFQTHLDSLKSTFLKIQPLLQDAEVQQWKNVKIRNWLTELKDVAHDVENVLDEVATQDLTQQVEHERGKSCLCFSNSLSFRCKMARKVKTVGNKLTILAEEGKKFNLTEHHGLPSRETCSSVIESEIVGRQDEKILEKLLDEGLEKSDLSVYAIWGMGGMGKTTLAKLVHNNEKVQKHFVLKIWVCVSEDFDVKRLVTAIIESIDRCKCTLSDLDPLQRNLREKLMKNKFLLVLDDIWNEDTMKWDELRNILSCGSKGSVVMVTTRNQKIALMMATIGTHAIDFLSDEDSWRLFKQRAFPTGQEADENFVSIGKAIVKKCGGIALAIKALGGLMGSKSTEREWLTVVNSEIWNVLVGNENDITPALRLSYYNLPPYMRQCFAYSCVFPKDSVMHEDELIQLWMANGFVSSVNGQDLFVSGISIFKELTWRSFFQDIQIDDSGRTTCKMHDLMHDLAESIMSHDFYKINHERALEISKPMHLVCYYDCDFKLNKSTGNSVRTFYAFDYSTEVDEDLCSFILKQKYLRVLRFNDESSTKLLNFAYKFKHLRFLVLSCANQRKLPESITTLYNLQTLKLLDSHDLHELPKQLKVMKNLWFLEMDATYSIECTPPELRKLTLLRRLPIFIVGEDVSQQIDQLKELNLGGELTIKGLNNVRSFEDAKKANLMMKSDLTYLELEWTGDVGNKSPSHFDLVLQGLQPHYNIERIKITAFPGSKFSDWMSNLSLYKNLKEIELSDSNCEYLPAMGNLPGLTSLILRRLNCIKCLGADWHGNEECSFPRLKTMEIRRMENLEEWSTPELMRSYPCLTKLDILRCPKLSSMPSFPNVKDMEIVDPGCVAVITSINNCTSLESLEFKYNDEDNALPDDFLQKNHKALKYLVIGGSGIKSMSNMLNNLSALKTLKIESCSNLENDLPRDLILSRLTSLKNLRIDGCNKLREFPAAVLEQLPSLKSLRLVNCSELEALCGPLEKPSPLQLLLFWGLPKLQCLPECVQQLTALTELHIWNCRGLQKLGESITSLKSLRWLDISNCSEELKKRCEKEEGEDWPNISHIPYIQINDDIIQDQRRSN